MKTKQKQRKVSHRKRCRTRIWSVLCSSRIRIPAWFRMKRLTVMRIMTVSGHPWPKDCRRKHSPVKSSRFSWTGSGTLCRIPWSQPDRRTRNLPKSCHSSLAYSKRRWNLVRTQKISGMTSTDTSCSCRILWKKSGFARCQPWDTTHG